MASAAVTPAFQLQTPYESTFLATTTQLDSTFSTAALISGQPIGPLLTFFGTARATEAAADVAFALLGGEIVWRQTSVGTASTSEVQVFWVIVSTFPTLTLRQVGTTNAVYEISIRLAHTLAR